MPLLPNRAPIRWFVSAFVASSSLLLPMLSLLLLVPVGFLLLRVLSPLPLQPLLITRKWQLWRQHTAIQCRLHVMYPLPTVPLLFIPRIWWKPCCALWLLVTNMQLLKIPELRMWRMKRHLLSSGGHAGARR